MLVHMFSLACVLLTKNNTVNIPKVVALRLGGTCDSSEKYGKLNTELKLFSCYRLQAR